MKKIIVLIALTALAVTPFAAQAGINPVTAGLPVVNLTEATGTGTDNTYYIRTDTTVPGKEASVMCVLCHTRNPSTLTLYRGTNGYGLTGSHWVTSNFADTSPGGGYSDGSGTKIRPGTLPGSDRTYFADNTSGGMTTSNGWYGLPRYGYIGTGGPTSTTNRSTGTAIICESCHNIVRNIGPAKLLATGFANGGAAQSNLLPGVPLSTPNTPLLCIGCHGDMDGGVNMEWQLHPNSTGVAWAGTHHHRNTPGTAVFFGGGAGNRNPVADAGMYRMDPADYNRTIGSGSYQMWAAGPGQLNAARDLSWTANAARIKPLAGNDNGQIGPRGSTLMCTNCHRAHNAVSSAGATILMRGDDVSAEIGTGPIPTGRDDGERGLTRMQDRGGRSTAFNNTNPLCMACHL